MHYQTRVLFYCVFTIALNSALSYSEDVSEEMGEMKLKTWQNESMDSDPPDSHEAMNNRENDASVRTKREYQLIKNTNQEVDQIDPSRKKTDLGSNVTAGELLLELLVKIAAHPEQWDKVHNLLEHIDSDIKASKKIIEDLQNEKVTPEPKPEIEEAEVFSDNTQPGEITKKTGYESENEWPMFQNMNKVSFLNTAPPENSPNTQHKNFFKDFAYHRVTGRPMYLNKNPKAYIAVSVIAPKPMNTRSNADDLILEKELRQLKPWTHNQNLKNMASLRSRWVIQRDNINNLVIP